MTYSSRSLAKYDLEIKNLDSAEDINRQKIIEARYDDYIAKPFFFEDLTALVIELIVQKTKA